MAPSDVPQNIGVPPNPGIRTNPAKSEIRFTILRCPTQKIAARQIPHQAETTNDNRRGRGPRHARGLRGGVGGRPRAEPRCVRSSLQPCSTKIVSGVERSDMLTTSSSSEPGLRGELSASSAELSLVEIVLKRFGAKRHNKRPALIG